MSHEIITATDGSMGTVLRELVNMFGSDNVRICDLNDPRACANCAAVGAAVSCRWCERKTCDSHCARRHRRECDPAWVCAHCKSRSSVVADLKRCTGCKSVRYCNAKCQREHWNATHRGECDRLRQLKLEQRAPAPPTKNKAKKTPIA